MTYKSLTSSKCEWVEYRMSATQAVAVDDIIKFDPSTKRTTGGDSVSYNGTTGVLSLSSTKRYWVQASLAIQRSSNTAYRVDWVEESALTRVDVADGGFSAIAQRTGGSTYYTSSHVCHLMVDYPSAGFRLNYDAGPSATILTLTNLFIIEAG